MYTPNQNEKVSGPDNWALHEALGREYARRRDMRGGKTIHRLVAEANAPRFPRRSRPGRGPRAKKP